MKKMICVMLTALMFVVILGGCGSTAESDGISVVTTIFPEYDWVREIAKGNDNIEITMLLDNGVDIHSYQPTADDIVKVSSCDMFIYVGGESDEWVEDVLKKSVNKDMVVINLLDILGDSVREEEMVEGMEHQEEGHEEGDAHEEEEHEFDEHVWLSLKNTEIICQAIADKLMDIDADNKKIYEANVKAYIEKLDTLHKEYQNVVDAASVKTVLFGDRFSFRYLVDDYGLDYYAAFAGCSAESEASFETIKFLAEKIDELGLNSILQLESSDGKLAETIKESSKEKNQQILTLDSMQSTTSKDVEAGTTYLSVMESNLKVLKKALE